MSSTMYTPPPEDALYEHPHALLFIHAIYLGVLSAPYPVSCLIPLVALFTAKHAKDVYPLKPFTLDYVNSDVVYLLLTGMATYHFYRAFRTVPSEDKLRVVLCYLLWHIVNGQYKEHYCHYDGQVRMCEERSDDAICEPPIFLHHRHLLLSG